MKGTRRIVPLVLLVLGMIAPAARAGDIPTGAKAVAAVEDLEHQRQHAMVSVDEETLKDIFAEDMTYIHSTGLAQSRDDLLGMLRRGDIKYVAFHIESLTYRAYGTTVVGTGTQAIDLTSSNKPFTSRSRFTVVYAPVRGAYRLVAYQSTSMPDIVMQQDTGGDRKSP
jgi:Domain of unknown function (DUF4440)